MGSEISKKASFLLEMEAQYVQHNLNCPASAWRADAATLGIVRIPACARLQESAGLRPWKDPRPALGAPRMPVMGWAQDAWQVLMNRAGAARCPLGCTRPGCCLRRPRQWAPCAGTCESKRLSP